MYTCPCCVVFVCDCVFSAGVVVVFYYYFFFFCYGVCCAYVSVFLPCWLIVGMPVYIVFRVYLCAYGVRVCVYVCKCMYRCVVYTCAFYYMCCMCTCYIGYDCVRISCVCAYIRVCILLLLCVCGCVFVRWITFNCTCVTNWCTIHISHPSHPPPKKKKKNSHTDTCTHRIAS